MDDIREDDMPEQPPASAGVKPDAGGPAVVGPESEVRGGPEAADETLSRPAEKGR
jgi:hypothetical protein